jgi:hypothetical protein
MTHDAAQTTTWGGALAALRDKVAGLTGWSIAYDYSGSTADPVASGEGWAWQTPTGEYIEISLGGNANALPAYGTDYDTGAGGFNTEWSYPGSPYISPAASNYDAIAYTDSVQYWLTYVDRGFVFYVSREEGDGKDGDCFIGFAEINKSWDYTTAQAPESEMAFTLLGQRADGNGYTNEINYIGKEADSANTAPARGLLNPDGNFGNFPMTETTFQHASAYDDGLIGTHDLWALDDSDSRTAHLDTVDVGGTPSWKVVKEYLSQPLLMRME